MSNPTEPARELKPHDSLILNLSGWIERRSDDIGSYAQVIIHGVEAYENEIVRLRAERDALQKAMDAAGNIFCGDYGRSKDWAVDLQHENGNYNCNCAECGAEFIGHKRRRQCRDCAFQALESLVSAASLKADRREAKLTVVVEALEDITKLTGWTGNPHVSTLEYGPTTASRAGTIASQALTTIADTPTDWGPPKTMGNPVKDESWFKEEHMLQPTHTPKEGE